MAQRTIVELLDDIDGNQADETVRFAIDGVAYEIDLSTKNADELRGQLTPFVDKARRAGSGTGGGRSAGKAAGSGQNRERSADIRAWARRHDIQVNDRGRIPAHVVEAYDANDPSLAKTKGTAPQVTFQPGL